MKKENILEIKNLNISFQMEDELARAVHGVELTLEKGKVLGIVGESGCGKSVTAMSIMKLLPSNAIIESGEILYNGVNLLNLSQNEMQKIRGSKISLIPQDPLTSLNPLYTVGEQIIETIEYHRGISRKEATEIAVESLKSVKIPEPENRLNDYPHQFSGGMRQRAIIAMALCCNPELIIADEPTTALDVTVQAQILDLIKQIQAERGTSLIFITHDLGVIAEFCNHVAVMYAGRIVEYAQVEDIFNNPLHPYTKGLLESLPSPDKEILNVIPGQPPAITENIPGCVFHPRCPYRMDICDKVDPVLTIKENNQQVYCHLYD
ncbi:MAG: dipeptide ABC transporter ATP-binding protein DppD [Candidatus Melainabacteria bacterium GWA2_34_9]|nr:MAG: dipeptide ABC transporter ATP-binding protein DppD [Candidatus Melainabacteria bacterium GWA2_34_9]